MDIRRPVEDIRANDGHVVRLSGKRFVVNGTVPMADVIVAAPTLARRAIRLGHMVVPRFVALLLVLLVTFIPASPIWAAGESEDSEIEIQELESETTEGEGTTEEVDEAASEEALESENEEPQGTDEFDESRLPSADNPAPEGWYDDDGVGEEYETEDETAEETEETEDEAGETVLSEDELLEQLRAEVYEEVITELEEEIQAFEEEKQRLQDGCLQYEDGSFFCLNPERDGGPVAPQASGAGTVYVQQDSVEGDGEIYYLPQGSTTPIPLTDDAVDDQFPSVDIEGRGFVYQSFINDRWQIRYRDGATGAVEQLTAAPYNSMHPAVFGDMVVWQGWPESNWEIFLARRQAGGWSVEQITDNAVHDMFPKVAGGFVTWQSNDGDDWQVHAYELATGITHQLSTGAGKHQNPRVALIWETEEDDGSRRILGLDLTTGEVETVGARPATPDPQNLPQPPLTDEEATITEAPAGTEDDTLPDDSGNGDDDL